MRRLIILLLLLCTTMSLAAQNLKIQWSQPLETSAKVTSFMAYTGGKIYTLSLKKDDYYIECFDRTNFSKLFSTKLDLPRVILAKQQIETIIFLGNKFTLFSSYYDKVDKKFHLNAYQVDMQGVLNPKPVELLKFEAESKKDIGGIFFRTSSDSSLVLIAHTFSDDKTKESHLELCILSKDLILISRTDNIVPQKIGDAYSILMNCYINNKKEIFIPELRLTTATEQRDTDLSYSIIQYSSEGKELIRFPVELEGKRIVSLELQFNSKQELMIYGYYNDSPGKKDQYYNAYNGTYFIIINPETGQPISSSVLNFDQELINMYYSAKQTNGQSVKYLGVHFRADPVIEKENGGYVILYEEYNVQYNYGPNGASSQTYYYGDITVVNTDANGDIKWVKHIPKRQYFMRKQGPLGIGFGPVMLSRSVNLNADESIYYSYNVVVTGEQITFIFNDLPVNLSVKHPRDVKVLKKIRGTIPVAVTLGENGEMSKKTLADVPGAEVNLCPAITLMINNQNLLVYGSKSGKNKIGFLSID